MLGVFFIIMKKMDDILFCSVPCM